jgi:carboxymethylenebutenolidase
MGRLETIETDAGSFRAYVTGEPRPGRPGVVVFHAWWGLNEDVVAYADRLAASDFAVIAPDMFGGKVTSSIDEAQKLADGADVRTVSAIALGTVDRLARGFAPNAPIGVVGFSFGAAWAVWAPTQRGQIKATVLYYGTYDSPRVMNSMVPVLGHFASSDVYESEETVKSFEEHLRAAGRPVVFYGYSDTGHWFAESSRADAYRADAAELAYRRTVEFLKTQLIDAE